MNEPDRGLAIDEPFPEETPEVAAPEVEEEAEPEGVVEVEGGRRMVDVSVVAAERKRVREKAEKDYAPIKAQAQEVEGLRKALNEAKPYVEIVKQHPEWLAPKPAAPDEPTISDEEASTYARRYQLYDAQSQLDIKTAKAIIADNRRETKSVADRAAQEAVAPIVAHTAKDRAARNFQTYAQQIVDEDGKLMADPEIVVDLWKTLPAELTQHEQVAEIAMDAALGRSIRLKRKTRVSTPGREPMLSESPGPRPPAAVTLTDRGKKLGLTESDLKGAQKSFNPGGMSPVGDW